MKRKGSNKNCKALRKHFTKKIKNFSKTKTRIYKNAKRTHKRGLKRVMKTRQLIDNVCKDKVSDPNCEELKAIYDDKSDVYNSIINTMPKTRRGLQKGKYRLNTANRLSKKICRKY